MKRQNTIPKFSGSQTAGIIAVAALSVALSAGCRREARRAPARPGGGSVPVVAAGVSAKDVPVQIRAIGNVMTPSRVTIRSQITAQLQAVHFKEGQEVKRGEVLFTMDPRPARATLEQARANLARDEAQLENAKIAFERTRSLFDSKLTSQEDFDDARTSQEALQGTVLADQAAITNATLNLAYTTIRSPVDGVAGAQLVFAGNVVKSPDDAMLTIHQIHPIYVSFAVPERYLPEIRREMSGKPLKVTASFTGLRGTAPEGELTFVDNAVDMTTGTILLKATFANQDRALWPGQFVQVGMDLAELPNATVVPSQAVQTGQQGEYVFVVKPDQTVELRGVKIGESFAGETVVADGLQAGETVVTDGQLNLVNGTKVGVKPAPAAGASTQAPMEQP